MKQYKDYAAFLAGHFNGKMQKLTVNAGFSCPNRDGTLGRGGCVYCNNASFSPAPTGAGSVAAQIEKGKEFFGKKYPDMRYLAYFQSYTSTYNSLETLRSLYAEALAAEGVDGLIIGTRPDCVSPEFMAMLRSLNCWAMLEFGAESAHDATLRAINRCHSWDDTERAVSLAAEWGFPVGLHLIMGLPGETREMMLETVRKAAELPIQTLKLHQLQIIKGTTLARELTETPAGLTFRGLPVKPFEVDDYLALCAEAIREAQAVNPAIAFDRFTSQAPDSLLIAPRWGLKNYQFTNLLDNRLANQQIT